MVFAQFKWLAPIKALALCLLFAGCGSEDEPPEVVYEREDGTTTADIAAAAQDDALVRFKIYDEKDLPPKAKLLHQESRQLGQAGQYQEGLTKLEEAITLAPDWPYPHYDMAFTYLLMQQPAKALEKYRAVDLLAPEGFMTTKTAIWALEREERGMFPQGLYLNYVMLEWKPKDERRQAIATIIENMPNFAPAWKDAAIMIDDPGKRIMAIDQGLTAAPDADTHGILILNKALALEQLGKLDESKAMLQALIDDPKTTLAAEAIAREALKQMPQ